MSFTITSLNPTLDFRFREAGIAPSAYSYNSLIHLLVLAGKGDEGEAVLRDMQEGGAKVSDITWNGLISAHNRVSWDGLTPQISFPAWHWVENW
jgi:pentatricopeptide repeat protein